ncbi:monomeric sarcosine oxidase-like [Lytechinus pictus]|uniref:monomeric sarcosine oxidase-like n=1 Tax=Lytechinus pictus TaxID=7653 RepID=UPI0030B9D2EC
MAFDICVVGAGMVGSAAAKWLAMDGTKNVCLIGPQEPTEEEDRKGERQIFGCHYDEGRITREIDRDYVWGLLAKRSIQRYRDIENESDINFYNEVGCVFIEKTVSQEFDDYLNTARKLEAYIETYDASEFHTRYPYLKISPDCRCIWAPQNTGHISPRKLVAAQQKIARSHGCDIINEVVVDIMEESEDGGKNLVRISTESGREVLTRRVLLCTGCFSNFHHLLPDEKKLDLLLCKAVVVKAEVTKEDAMKIADMPTFWLGHEHAYILPPILYPDGKYFIKIGLSCSPSDSLQGLDKAAQWFYSKGKEHPAVKDTKDSLQRFMPDLKPVSLITDSCITTSTPTKQLYCDMLTAHTGILVGMNGWGAKSSDEIGRMGASMIGKGSWDYDLPHFAAENFKVRFKEDSKKDII